MRTDVRSGGGIWLTRVGTLLWGMGVVVGFYLLVISKTSAHLFSPWQTIHPAYIYIFFAATIILGFLTISRLNYKIILFLLIIHTFLMHSFLPLTHEFFYGADNWRHIAVEERILHQEEFTRPKITDSTKQSLIQRLDPGELSYWHFWWLTIIVTRLFDSDLITVNAWLGPIIWSVVFPLLLYQLGITLGWKRRRALIFVWLGLLPFAWIVAGSWTLPNNLGFLWYLAMVLVLLRRLNTPPSPLEGGSKRWYVPFLLVMGIVSLFGYILYALLFWMSWIGVEVVRRLKSERPEKMLVGLGVIGSLGIPLLEWLAGYSYFDPHHNFLGSIKTLCKSIIGWFIARGPYPDDVVAWNILFNQPPERAFAANLFLATRWWLLPAILLVTSLSLYGLYRCIASQDKIQQWFGGMYIALFGSYIFSHYFLTGEHILARRLDATLALLVMVTLGVGLQKLFEKFKEYYPDRNIRYLVGAGIVGFSILIATSYSLGPDTNVVTGDEYRAMQFVWSEIKARPDRCVLADTYPLIALEALSHRAVVGGGFPINQYFAQPERVKLFAAMQKHPDEGVWQEALGEYSKWNKTSAKTCWLVIDRSSISSVFQSKALPGNVKEFGDVVVWRYTNQ